MGKRRLPPRPGGARPGFCRSQTPLRRASNVQRIFLLSLGLTLLACSDKAIKPGPDPGLPTVLVLPFHTQGPGVPKMLDITETFVYMLYNDGRLRPRDTGEALDIVKTYALRGIYPAREKLLLIGSERNIDFIIIGKVSTQSKNNNPLQLQSMAPEIVDVKIRLIDARSGNLRQVIHQQREVYGSIAESLSEIFADIIGSL
jgi:hypothetical protein